MPDDVGGRPFPDGDEPDSHSHGAADEEFASVVFDEDFIRSARIHEPTAAERLLKAAQARAEAEAARARAGGGPVEEELFDDGDDGFGPLGEEYRRFGSTGIEPADLEEEVYGPYGRYGGSLRPYRSHVRWHRPVAWVLAVLMGIGMVALAFAAVYRGAASSRQSPAPPPATSEVDASQAEQPGKNSDGQPADGPGTLPSLSVVPGLPPAAAPRTG